MIRQIKDNTLLIYNNDKSGSLFVKISNHGLNPYEEVIYKVAIGQFDPTGNGFENVKLADFDANFGYMGITRLPSFTVISSLHTYGIYGKDIPVDNSDVGSSLDDFNADILKKMELITKGVDMLKAVFPKYAIDHKLLDKTIQAAREAGE